MNVKDFTGKKVTYDKAGQMIFGHQNTQMLLNIRGWGTIQNKFKTEKAAINFQDKFGQFVADAINEKLQRD